MGNTHIKPEEYIQLKKDSTVFKNLEQPGQYVQKNAFDEDVFEAQKKLQQNQEQYLKTQEGLQKNNVTGNDVKLTGARETAALVMKEELSTIPEEVRMARLGGIRTSILENPARVPYVVDEKTKLLDNRDTVEATAEENRRISEITGTENMLALSVSMEEAEELQFRKSRNTAHLLLNEKSKGDSGLMEKVKTAVKNLESVLQEYDGQKASLLNSLYILAIAACDEYCRNRNSKRTVGKARKKLVMEVMNNMIRERDTLQYVMEVLSPEELASFGRARDLFRVAASGFGFGLKGSLALNVEAHQFSALKRGNGDEDSPEMQHVKETWSELCFYFAETDVAASDMEVSEQKKSCREKYKKVIDRCNDYITSKRDVPRSEDGKMRLSAVRELKARCERERDAIERYIDRARNLEKHGGERVSFGEVYYAMQNTEKMKSAMKANLRKEMDKYFCKSEGAARFMSELNAVYENDPYMREVMKAEVLAPVLLDFRNETDSVDFMLDAQNFFESTREALREAVHDLKTEEMPEEIYKLSSTEMEKKKAREQYLYLKVQNTEAYRLAYAMKDVFDILANREYVKAAEYATGIYRMYHVYGEGGMDPMAFELFSNLFKRHRMNRAVKATANYIPADLLPLIENEEEQENKDGQS